jgi:hypothetical protein
MYESEQESRERSEQPYDELAAEALRQALPAGAFYYRAKRVRAGFGFGGGTPARSAHCEHVARLLEELGQRIEAGKEIDSVDAADIVFSLWDTMPLSFLEQLTLKAICATDRRAFSIPVGRRSMPDASAGLEDDRALVGGG